MGSIRDFFNGYFDREVTIHPKEWDTEFVRRFKLFLEENYGARFSETESVGPVGSQDFTIMPFTIGNSQLRLQAETYMGISIVGPTKIVDEIISHYKNIGEDFN
jgi:hypothetical protein